MSLPLCAGLGWRPETAWLIDGRPRAAFSEVIAETIDPRRPPRALAAAIERGLAVVAHGVSLSLGSAAAPERARVRHLAAVAKALRSPLVSEHVAFSRSGRIEAPHFLPVPRTRAQLELLVDNVRRVIDALPVPFALENVAAPLAWPGDRIAEADFLAELVERTGALLLLDVANLHANLVNHGGEAAGGLDRLPLHCVAYLHVAGGARIDGMWRDTHAHAVAPAAHALLAEVLARTGPVPILLERDHEFGDRAAIEAELDSLEVALSAAPAVGGTEPSIRASRGSAAGAPSSAAARPPRPEPPAPDAPAPGLATSARAALAGEHVRLLRALLEPALPPPTGFAPLHIAETRAILRTKTARARRHGHDH